MKRAGIIFVKITIILFFYHLLTSGGTMCVGKPNRVILPESVGKWARDVSPEIVNSENIFKYMDGAGELYIGYRFSRLEVYRYKSRDPSNGILAELYYMDGSDDAYGLLSLDWSGEPVNLTENEPAGGDSSSNLPVNALYGAGLLRIWSDNIYARILTDKESEESKAAVLFIGKKILSGREKKQEPSLALPVTTWSDWTLKKDSVAFFRSYLVLNSIYFLSQRNILDLDHSIDGITALYETETDADKSKKIRIVHLKYESSERAKKALEHFISAYLPEYKAKAKEPCLEGTTGCYEIEDGWVGFKLFDGSITLIFEAPDAETVWDFFKYIN